MGRGVGRESRAEEIGEKFKRGRGGWWSWY